MSPEMQRDTREPSRGPMPLSETIGELLSEGGSLAQLRLVEEGRVQSLLDAQLGAQKLANKPGALPSDTEAANNVNVALADASRRVEELNKLTHPDE